MWWNPTAFQIEPLVIIDWSDGAGMGTLHIVGFDFQIRHALSPRPVRQGEVAIGLKRLGTRSMFADLDQSGVDAFGDRKSVV